MVKVTSTPVPTDTGVMLVIEPATGEILAAIKDEATSRTLGDPMTPPVAVGVEESATSLGGAGVSTWRMFGLGVDGMPAAAKHSGGVGMALQSTAIESLQYEVHSEMHVSYWLLTKTSVTQFSGQHAKHSLCTLL